MCWFSYVIHSIIVIQPKKTITTLTVNSKYMEIFELESECNQKGIFLYTRNLLNVPIVFQVQPKLNRVVVAQMVLKVPDSVIQHLHTVHHVGVFGLQLDTCVIVLFDLFVYFDHFLFEQSNVLPDFLDLPPFLTVWGKPEPKCLAGIPLLSVVLKVVGHINKDRF